MENRDSEIIKKVLENRAETPPSNFTYIMMSKIEAEKRRIERRCEINGYIYATIASVVLIGMVIYIMLFKIDINIGTYFSYLLENKHIILFYTFILLCAFTLLFFDYFIRSRYGNKHTD